MFNMMICSNVCLFSCRWTPVKIKTEPVDLPPDPKRRKVNREKWRLMTPPKPEDVIVIDRDDTQALPTEIKDLGVNAPGVNTACSCESVDDENEARLEEQLQKIHDELALLSSDEDCKKQSTGEECVGQQEREWEAMQEKRNEKDMREKSEQTKEKPLGNLQNDTLDLVPAIRQDKGMINVLSNLYSLEACSKLDQK